MKKTKTTSKFPRAVPDYEPHTLIYDMPSEMYHSITGTFSSSQLKDMLDDEVTFKKKYIEKSIEREDVPAFAVGNYFHTGVLEPHKLKDDMAVFNGKVRRGAEWDRFKAQHEGRTIVTSSQVDEANRLISLVKESEVAMSFIERGKPEVSLFVDLNVYGDDIYAPMYGKRLTRDFGWIDEAAPSEGFVGLVVKVRADSLGDDFVLDLKSTTGNARSERAMRTKISYYEYGLSASFYLDIFSLERGEQIEDFIWTFASKDMANCMSWKASEDNKKIGRVKWMRAIVRLANCIRTNWEISDTLGVLEPEFYQLEYLKERDLDLL